MTWSCSYGESKGRKRVGTRYVYAHEVLPERGVVSMTELLLRYLESLGRRLHSNAWR